MRGLMSLVAERVDAGIAVVRIDRPEVRNALDLPTLRLLEDELAALAADPELRVLVLGTTSTVALCAGADVNEELTAAGGVERMAAFTRVYAALEAFPVPTIAVCVGNCVGAGAELVAGCDLRVAGEGMKLAWAGARLGVPVGPARLVPLLGLARAKDLAYTGRVVRAAEAEALGLLSWRGPDEGAEAAALELAGRLCAQSPDGLRKLKAMFRDYTGSEDLVARENEELMAFQRDGVGLPFRRV